VALAGEVDHVIGVDTHMDTHTAALCDARGRVLSRLQVTADPAGYASLLAWARPQPALAAWPGQWKAPVITDWAWPATWPPQASR